MADEMKIDTSVSPSLHPENVRAIDGYESHEGYVRCAVDALTVAYDVISSIHKARDAARQNSAWTEDNQTLQIASFADKKQERATKAIDTATSNLTRGIKALEESLSAPLEQKAGLGTVNEEIRRHCKSLPRDDRAKFVFDAIERGDTKTLTAILGAPAYLSGLMNEQLTHYTRRFHESQSREIVERIDVMKKALEIVERAGPLVITQTIAAVGGMDARHRVQSIRARVSAAEKALQDAGP